MMNNQMQVPVVEIATAKTKQFKINCLDISNIEYIKNECDIISSYQVNELDNTIDYSVRFYKFDLRVFNYQQYSNWLSTSVIQAFISWSVRNCGQVTNIGFQHQLYKLL